MTYDDALRRNMTWGERIARLTATTDDPEAEPEPENRPPVALRTFICTYCHKTVEFKVGQSGTTWGYRRGTYLFCSYHCMLDYDANHGRHGCNRPRKEWSEDDNRTLMEMRAAGMSYKLIGQRLGRSGNAVQMHYRVLTGAKGAEDELDDLGEWDLDC